MNDFADAVRHVCEEAAELHLPSFGLHRVLPPVATLQPENVISRQNDFADINRCPQNYSEKSLPTFVSHQPAFVQPCIEAQAVSECIEMVGDQPVSPARKTSPHSTSLPSRCVEEPAPLDDESLEAPAKKRGQSDNSSAPFACQHCRRRFKRKESLQRHIGTHDEKAFLCDVCDQTFSSALSLREHHAIHDGELPYECGHCQRKFRQNSCLRRHLLLHLATRPAHECPTCGRCFLQKVYLRSHLRSHTGIRPYTCSTCGKSFGHRSTLKRHLVTHTSERPHTCDVCSATFADASSWRRHVRNHSAEKSNTSKVASLEPQTTTTFETVDDPNAYGDNVPVVTATSWVAVAETASTSCDVLVDYVQNPDFGSLEYFDWLSDFISSVSASHLPMDDELFASVTRVHTDISDMLATPCGPLSHDKDAFLGLVNISQQLHAIIQNHRSQCLTKADVQ